MKHTFWVVRYKTGNYLQRSGAEATHIKDMCLFCSRKEATRHVKWLRACSSISTKYLLGCRYLPVYARLEEAT